MNKKQSNNTALVKKEDGIYVMNMPSNVCQPDGCVCNSPCESYEKILDDRLEQALSSALWCDNQEQAKRIMFTHHKHKINASLGEFLASSKTDHPYVIPNLKFEVLPPGKSIVTTECVTKNIGSVPQSINQRWKTLIHLPQ